MTFSGQRVTAQIQLQGLADAEYWSTDTMSTLLTRNNGKPCEVYRLRLWGAAEPFRGVYVFGHGEMETGDARQFGETGTSFELEQGGIRIARDERFVLDAGRLIHPVGAFSARIFSNRNPLVGTPDGYSPIYPNGVQLSGDVGRFDYRAALVDLPLTHEDYTPDPGKSWRPAAGVGITPFTGLHIGASGTIGSYLNSEIDPTELGGASWRSFDQRILGADMRYGFSRYDIRAEYAWSDYDVPNSGRVGGHSGYVEGRATLTPRLFAAIRGEENHYPFIAPAGGNNWIARRTDFRDVEAGLGFWVTATTLVKASYRTDDWAVNAGNAGFLKPGGRALAFQLSQSFDLVDLAQAALRK